MWLRQFPSRLSRPPAAGGATDLSKNCGFTFPSTVVGLVVQLGRLADTIAALNQTVTQWVDSQKHASGGRPQTLLVVDQNPVPTLRRRLRRVHHVLEATSIAVALEELRNQRVDVLLTEHDLGEEHTGLWLLEKTRTRWPFVKRLLMSAQDGRAFEEHLALDLVHGYFQKPVDITALLESLQGGGV